MMFYAPRRAMAEVRDRAPLGPALLTAFVAQGLLQLYVLWPHLGGVEAARPGRVAFVILKVADPLLFLLIVFVPTLIFVVNLLERRGGFAAMLRQDYASVASTVLYARYAAAALALPLGAMARATGQEARTFEQHLAFLEWMKQPPVSAVEFAGVYPFSLMVPFFAVWLVFAIRESFRFSWGRAVAALLATSFGANFLLYPLWQVFAGAFNSLATTLLASPLLLLLLFFLMRGYIGEVMSGQRARASFRRNLETATLNPADASAHYNLGLLHLQRRELAEARARFERAVGIDPEEVDAHYQLGRIARAEGRWADAIRHYTEAVSRNPAHAQHEVWREAAATYVSAGQFADAEESLERFFEHRQEDPEGLYLMGRAQFGLGRARESREWMQRCIEAVRTAPAYKYRAERRWMSEAQQFLRTLA